MAEDRPAILLLVEDNPDDAELTTRVLRRGKLAADIVLARNGVEALDYLFGTGSYAGRDPAAVPMLVLLDLGLPKLNGMQVLKRIREEPVTARLPVVILTSSDEPRDLATSEALGSSYYMRKPLRFAEFTEALKKLGLA